MLHAKIYQNWRMFHRAIQRIKVAHIFLGHGVNLFVLSCLIWCYVLITLLVVN